MQLHLPLVSYAKRLKKTINSGGLRAKKNEKDSRSNSSRLVGSLACPVFVTAAEENEETVQMSSLPEAAQKTIKDKAGSNEIERIEKKTENGQTLYEAVVKKSGKEWSIEVDASGKFLKQYQESKEKEEKGEKY